jgi:hypothetical protein
MSIIEKQTRHCAHTFKPGSPFRSYNGPVVPSLTTEFLRQEIERAEIVAEEAVSSLVTIGTRVQFIDHSSHKI